MADGMVQLKANGAIFGGWKQVEIKTGIEQIAGTFQLQVSERWPGQNAPSPLLPGSPCEILLDGRTIITGYVDSTEAGYGEQSHNVTVSGRDKAGDLVDCAAIHKTGQWKSRRLDQIAMDLCAPFGIKVVVQADVGAPFPSFNIQEGERVFETLDRAARMRAVLLVSDGLGNLIITRAGRTRAGTDLVENVNIKAARGKFDWKERFGHYVVKGQYRGTDDGAAADAAGPSGIADDTAVDRYRPIVVLAEDQGHIATLKQRAEWEKNVRLGRANRATVTVQGWTNAGGLWRPNTIVHLHSPLLYADLDLLIASVTYRLDEGGTTADLELCRPEAFDLLAGVTAGRLARKISQKTREGAAVRMRGDNKKWLKANAGAGYEANISTISQGEGWR